MPKRSGESRAKSNTAGRGHGKRPSAAANRGGGAAASPGQYLGQHAVPVEITWGDGGIRLNFTTEVEWWDETLGRRVRVWGRGS